jgi:hypothetical protein
VTARPGLTTPTLYVVPGEGDPYTIQATNADLVAYDMTAYKHKWPPMTAAPFLWLSFLGWHASRRTGVIPQTMTYEGFRDSVQEVTAASDTGAADAVPPTGPEAESGY